MQIAIIGGGAAGFFAAIHAKKKHPKARVVIYEKTKKLLSKVRISGGGRCNVTHACFDPRELVKNYPRGSRELLGPFHTFGPTDTIAWFKERGVILKTEKDHRMFPETDLSETIIHCLMQEANDLGVEIELMAKLKEMRPGHLADKVILATGSAKGPWAWAEELGHTIVAPVPSLFTFNVPNFSLSSLSGVSVQHAKIQIDGTKLSQTGPLLITHWGFSGPAALKLSAFAARELAESSYDAKVIIDWVPEISEDELMARLKQASPKKKVENLKITPLPKKLWSALAQDNLINRLKQDTYQVRGKTTNKEEFVTAGGIELREVNFKKMESKICPGLFFCGEVLNIDGITGGFNFQNAWTTGYIAGNGV